MWLILAVEWSDPGVIVPIAGVLVAIFFGCLNLIKRKKENSSGDQQSLVTGDQSPIQQGSGNILQGSGGQVVNQELGGDNLNQGDGGQIFQGDFYFGADAGKVKDLEDRVTELEKLVKESPASVGLADEHEGENEQVNELYRNAIAAISDLQSDDAIELLDQILVLEPGDFETLNAKAVALSLMGHPQESTDILEKLRDENPDWPIVHANLGTAYSALGLHKLALESLERSIQLGMADSKIYINLGNTYDRLELYDEALANYQKAYGLDPEDMQALVNVSATFGKLQQPQKALEVAEQVLKMEPENVRALCNKAVSLINLKQVDEGLAILEQQAQKSDLAADVLRKIRARGIGG